MGRVNYFLVLIVLSALITINAKEQFEYNYIANIIASNKASDKGYSKWTISGKLTEQNLEDKRIMKLDDLKTSVFNGDKTVKEPELQDPLEDVKFITTPFAVYYNSGEDVKIAVGKNEPSWSTNIKRAIASIFHIDTNSQHGKKIIEQTLYGDCEVTYERFPQNDKEEIYKMINREKCSSVNTNWKNVESIDPEDENKIRQVDNRRYYKFDKSGDKLGKLKYIRSTSNFSYPHTPSVRAKHHIEQNVEIRLISSTEEFTPFEVSEDTETVSVVFDFTNEEKNKTQSEVVEKYKTALSNFKKEFKKRPIENADIRNINKVDQLYTALSELNSDEIAALATTFLSSDEQDDAFTLTSLLPYVGTQHTINLITDFAKTDRMNDIIMMKLLATFPVYVNEPTQEKLNELEFLADLKHVENIQVKYAGILSFASLVSETFERGDAEEKFLAKIFNKYHTGLKDSENYEEKLTYLLGLINLARSLKEELMLQIILDHNLDPELRTLAIFGFKKYLVNPEEEDVFSQVWPIAQNTSENFDVRVSALDLLLSSNITEKAFDTIVNTFDKKPENPVEEHIANYVFTSLHALENSTGFSDYMSNFATARLQKGKIPRFSKSWSTGNYRLAFSDDEANFGASLQARLIGTPISNGLNIIHISFDHFEMSLKLESYTLYLKLGGVYETVYGAFLDRKTENETVSELIDLIKKCGCELKKGEDIHVDLAIFTEGRAIFGLHLNKDNIDSYAENSMFLEILKLLVVYQSISYPLINYNSIPSETGTLIEINEEIEDIFYQEWDKFEQFLGFGEDHVEVKDLVYHFKSVSTYDFYIKCNNPLAKVDALVYKHRKEQMTLDFPFKINTTSKVISWSLKNDTFRRVSDSLLGTAIYEDENEDNFKHYCRECDEYFEIPIGNHSEDAFELQDIGIIIYVSRTNNSEEQKQLNDIEPARQLPFHFIQRTHRSNGFAFPPAKPVMYLLHLNYYLKTINELDSSYFGIGPAFPGLKFESVLDLNIDVDQIVNGNDPLDGGKLNFELLFHNQNLEGEVLSGFNTTFESVSSADSLDEKSKSHVQANIAFYIDSYNNYSEGSYHKICVNSETKYPNKRSDKLSLKPIKPAKGKTTIAWGAVPSFSQCPETLIKFTDIHTATDAQNRKVEESEEYKKCQKDAEGLKYIPPTEECIKAHDALSRYDVYGLYVDFEQAAKFKFLEDVMEKTKLGYKVMEYNHIDEGHVNITISHAFAEEFLDVTNPELLDYEENSAFYDFLTVDPTAVAYDDYDIRAGISSTCTITPKTVKTFNGNYEEIFKGSQEEVAFVECKPSPTTGLTVQNLNNKAVGFKFWHKSNVLQASIEHEKLALVLNGEKVSKTPETQNKNMKIYFLEEDVIYVVCPTVEIYYTTEYISIKAIAVYNKMICGKCSYENHK